MEKPQRFRVTSTVLMPLTVKSNLAGARQALGHFGAIGLAAATLWFALGSWWALPLTVLLGYFLAFLFNAEHETAHRTAFKTPILNDIVGHIAGWLILLPYEYYRVYHWDHHRYTQNPDKDPELSFVLPTSRLGLVWYWSGLPFWWLRMRMLVAHGVLGNVTVPWVSESKRGEIAAEARKYLAVYALAISISVLLQSWIPVWLWIVTVMVGQLFLRPYLLAEHTGCLHTPDMLENTRTIYTNRFVRFFAWNMPFHAEHHAYPAVPFHALAKLNRELARHIVHTEAGYPAAAVTTVRHVLALMDAPLPDDARSDQQ